MSTIQVINAKHPSSATNNIVLDNIGNAAFAGTAAMASSFLRNRIINGDMRIDQRNAGASVTASATGANVYTLDRWSYYVTAASKFTIQQNAASATPPSGFTNYLGVTSSSAYTVGSGDILVLRHAIEGFNVSDFGWGAAGARSVTLSFWVRSSLTGTFGGSLCNNAGDRSYPFSYTISAANTWEQKSITVTGDTSGTWFTTNGVGIYVQISLGTGATYSATAGAWAGAFYASSTGATSVVGTNGATFYITGVQLEVGSAATPFERRQYGQELALCQRYYSASTTASRVFFQGYAVSGSGYPSSPVYFKVSMRASPTVTLTNSDAFGFPSTVGTTSISQDAFTESRTSNSTQNSGYFISSWTASAEL